VRATQEEFGWGEYAVGVEKEISRSVTNNQAFEQNQQAQHAASNCRARSPHSTPMGNVFATHAASDEDTIIYLKSKDTGKFWHSNSREGEGFKFSKTKNTSTAWIIEWNSGDISVGSIINLKSVANGGYLHSNMDEDEDEGMSWGSQDAEEAQWRIDADMDAGEITSGMTIYLESCAEEGQFLHSNSEDGGSVSWGERDADYAWTIYFGYDDAAAAPRAAAPPAAPNQRAVMVGFPPQRQAPRAPLVPSTSAGTISEDEINSLVESLRADASAFHKGAELGRGGCIVYAGTFGPSGMTAAIKEFVERDSLEECEDEVRTTIAANAVCSWGTPRIFGWQQGKSRALVAMEVAGGVSVSGGERAIDLEGFIDGDRCTSVRSKLLVLQRTAGIMRCLHAARINHGDLDLGQMLMMGADASVLATFASSPEDADAAEIEAMRLADWGGGGVGAEDADLFGDFHAFIVFYVRALFMNREEKADYDEILAHSRTEGDFSGRSLSTIDPPQVRAVAEMLSLPRGRDTVSGVRAAESVTSAKDEGEEAECTFTILLPSGLAVNSSSGEFIDHAWAAVTKLLADAIANTGGGSSYPQAPAASAPPAPAPGAAVVVPVYQTMQVTVPAGVGEGQQFLIMTPSGQQMQVVCPAGAGPGMPIQVQVPI